MESEILAYRKFPLPNGVDYFEKDLTSTEDIVKLFDYCQILEAVILEAGWEFLFKNYTLKELIEINKESGWFDDEDEGEVIKSFFYHSLISGFEPLTMQYGNYFEFTDVFQNLKGNNYQIDWGKIYNLKNEL